MGSGRDFVDKVAREETRAITQGFSASRQGINNKANQTDSPINLEAGSGKGKLPDGTVVDVTLIGGNPNDVAPGIRLPNGKWVVVTPSKKVPFYDGAMEMWGVIGGYSSAPWNSADATGMTSFPEFNVLNLKNGSRYRIPKEHLATLYTQITTGEVWENFYGEWWAVYTGTAIVIVRLASTLVSTVVPLANETASISTLTTHTETLHVFSAIITGFTLDSDNELVDCSSATITQKYQTYPYATFGTFSPQSDIPLAPGEDPKEIITGFPLTNANFVSWNWGVVHFLQLRCKPVISTNSDGSMRVDVIGAWRGTTSAQAIYQFIVSGGYQLSQVRIIEDGGLFSIEDFHGTTTTGTTDYGRSGLADRVTMSLTAQQRSGVFAQHSYTRGGLSSEATGDVGVRLNSLTANSAFRVSENSFMINNDTVPRLYYMSPYRTIHTTLDQYTVPTPLFIIDETRSYHAYDSVTNWDTSNNLVKTTDTGKFLELVNENLGGGQRRYTLKKWTYDPSGLTTMTPGTVLAGNAISSTLQLKALVGNFNNPRLMDYCLLFR